MRKAAQAAVAATMLLGLFSTVPAEAAVRYSFEAFSSLPQFGSRSGSFELITTSFLSETTPRQDFASANLSSCSVSNPGYVCAVVQSFFPTSSNGYDIVGFGTQASDGSQLNRPFYFFADKAFSAYGTYSTINLGSDQAGRLVVSEVTSNAGLVPEPISWVMMIVGFCQVGALLRGRRRANGSVNGLSYRD